MIILLSCLSFLLTACSDKAAHNPDADWINEEILKQLSSLHESVAAIEQDIDAIKTQLANSDASSSSVKPAAAGMPFVDVPFTGTARLGNSEAPLALVEFSDYRCGYCQQHQAGVFPKLKAQWIDTGKLQYEVRHFPLKGNTQSLPAAIAAHCAGEQGQYWAMHENLFANSRFLGEAFYQASAKSLGVDNEAYEHCRGTEAARAAVQADVALGKRLGVTGTPRFYLGRVEGKMLTDVRILSGIQRFETLDRLLQQHLSRGRSE